MAPRRSGSTKQPMDTEAITAAQEALQARLTDLEQAEEEKERLVQENANLKQVCERLTLELVEVRPQVDGFNIAMDSVLDEKNQAIKEANRLKKVIVDLNDGATVESLQTSLGKSQEELRLKWHDESKLREKVSALETENKNLQARVKTILDELAAIEQGDMSQWKATYEQHLFLAHGAIDREERLMAQNKEFFLRAENLAKMQMVSDEIASKKLEDMERQVASKTAELTALLSKIESGAYMAGPPAVRDAELIQVEECHEKILELTKEVARLNDMLLNVEAERDAQQAQAGEPLYEEVNGEIFDLTIKNAGLNELLRHSNEARERQRVRLEEYETKQISEMSMDIDIHRDQIRVSRYSFDRQTDELRALRRDNAELKERVDELTMQLAEAKAHNPSGLPVPESATYLLSKYQKLKAMNEQLMDEKRQRRTLSGSPKLQDELNMLKAKLAEFEQRTINGLVEPYMINGLMASIATVQERISAVSDQLTALESTAQTKEELSKELEKQVAVLKKAHTDVSNALVVRNNKLAGVEDRCHKLEEQVAAVQRSWEIATAQARINEHATTIAMRRSDELQATLLVNSNLLAEKSHFTAQLKSLTDDKKGLLAKELDQMMKLTKFQNDFQRVMEENQHLKQKNKQLDGENRRLRDKDDVHSYQQYLRSLNSVTAGEEMEQAGQMPQSQQPVQEQQPYNVQQTYDSQQPYRGQPAYNHQQGYGNRQYDNQRYGNQQQGVWQRNNHQQDKQQRYLDQQLSPAQQFTQAQRLPLTQRLSPAQQFTQAQRLSHGQQLYNQLYQGQQLNHNVQDNMSGGSSLQSGFDQHRAQLVQRDDDMAYHNASEPVIPDSTQTNSDPANIDALMDQFIVADYRT